MLGLGLKAKIFGLDLEAHEGLPPRPWRFLELETLALLRYVIFFNGCL